VRISGDKGCPNGDLYFGIEPEEKPNHKHKNKPD